MTSDIYASIGEIVLSKVPASINLRDDLRAKVTFGPPRDPVHGDMTTNVAMIVATDHRTQRRNPRDIAEDIADALRQCPEIATAEVAGPGFINLRLKPAIFHSQLPNILQAGIEYGNSSIGNGKRVNVEYVSANP